MTEIINEEVLVFKVGQRVFDYMFGWGRVVRIDKISEDITVSFDRFLQYFYYTKSGHLYFDEEVSLRTTLSTKKYLLDGISIEEQLRYEDYIGKWGKFKIDKNAFIISKLDSVKYTDYHIEFKCDFGESNMFEPLTDEEIKVLKLYDK